MKKTAVALIIFLLGQFALVANAAEQDDVETRYQKAVDLARSGEHEQGLEILSKILKANPDHYEVRRDYVVIATWNDDCDTALSHYEKIRNHPKQENYLTLAVADCLKEKGRDQQAFAMLKKAVKENPDDKELAQAHKEFQTDLKLATSPTYELTLGNTNSEGDNRDWFFDAVYTRQLKQQTRWYIHYYKSKAVDQQFETGDLSRLGVGILHTFNRQWLLDVELFSEVGDGSGSGYRASVTHDYNELLTLVGEYNSNSSDIPLRAKADNVETDSLLVSADYHTANYRWETFASVTSYNFTDSNDRLGIYGSAGYAYKMKERLEHRVIVDIFRSTNTLDAAAVDYYNPKSDFDLTLTHKTSYTYNSKYDRHVDHFYLSVGNYNQEGFASDRTYGARYEQEYDIDKTLSFNWGAGYVNRPYDGVSESEWSVIVSVSGKLD